MSDNKALADRLIERWRDAAKTERDYYADALRDCADQLEAALREPSTPQAQGDGFTAADMMDARAEERARLSTPQARPTIRVQKLGMYGAAYDGPEDKRAYTYTHQPANGPAYSLGHALSCAAIRQGGDFIDGGLSLLKELEAKGFGVFEIADLPAPSVQARPDGGDKLALSNDLNSVYGNTNAAITEHLWRLGYRKHPTPAPDVARPDPDYAAAIRTLWLVLQQAGGEVTIPATSMVSADFSKCLIERAEDPVTGSIRLTAVTADQQEDTNGQE